MNRLKFCVGVIVESLKLYKKNKDKNVHRYAVRGEKRQRKRGDRERERVNEQEKE